MNFRPQTVRSEYSTKAIIVSSTKYGEDQRIFKCITENEGVEGFIVLAYKKSKTTNSRFSILSGYDFTYRKQSSLYRITLADCLFSFLEKDPKTMGIVFLLAEVLNRVLREGCKDHSMFLYIYNSLKDFSNKQVPNTSFHLTFLMELTRHLGFYPNIINSQHRFFDLKEGIFVDKQLSEDVLNEKSTKLIKSLLGMSFDKVRGKYTSVDKKHMTEVILKYYSIHLGPWEKFQSLEVLHSIFE